MERNQISYQSYIFYNKMENKRSFGGLVRKVVAPVVIGAAALMPMRASGEWIDLTNTLSDSSISAPLVSLNHESGTNEGYVATDGDILYQNTQSPAVDFYSMLSSRSNNKLSVDVRDLFSATTYHTQMKTRNLPVTESITGNLTFDISAATDFGGKPIFADIYKIDSNDETPNAPPIWEMLNINVRDYAQNQTPIGLSFSGDNSTIYNIDVKFVPEPGTLSLLAMAGLAGAGVTAYNLSKRKR